MIDLHTHTTYSDGTDNLISLQKKAEKAKLEVLSIIKKIDVKQYYTGKILTSCELYTTINGQTIELLGYHIDTDKFNKILPSLYHTQAQDNERQAKELLKICKKLGVSMDYDHIHIDYHSEYA